MNVALDGLKRETMKKSFQNIIEQMGKEPEFRYTLPGWDKYALFHKTIDTSLVVEADGTARRMTEAEKAIFEPHLKRSLAETKECK
jgi:hypothetical protein